MSQTRKMSLVESITNVLIGYTISIMAQLIIFPMFGIIIPLSDNLMIGACFTVVSIFRSYVIRRTFNMWQLHMKARQRYKRLMNKVIK